MSDEDKIDSMTFAEIHDNLRDYLDSGYVIDPVGYLEVVADRLQAAIAVLDTAELARGAAPSAPPEPVPDGPRVAGTAEHGWTRHGHRCCDQATGPRPPRVARCGGPAICRDCAADAAVRHSPKTGTFGPRVWAMPEIPEDVMAVKDRDGGRWSRATFDGQMFWRQIGAIKIDDYGAEETHLWTGTLALLRDRGPLTEVVEEATP